MAETYLSLARDKPFAYGNQETALIFCIIIAKAAQEGSRIFDFNRLTKEDQLLLYGEFHVAKAVDDIQALEGIFRKARYYSEKKTEANSESELAENSRYTDDSGTYYRKTLAGEEYLLLENGGLIPLEEVKRNGESLESYSIHRDAIREYVTVERRNASAIDHLTGLSWKIERLCTAPALLAQIEVRTSAVIAVAAPEYMFTIGGSGAGKGHLIRFAGQKLGMNYIFASLDEAREYSDIWSFDVGHSDDYPYLKQWATIIRERLMEAAYEVKKHLVRDCSGAPYKREAELGRVLN